MMDPGGMGQLVWGVVGSSWMNGRGRMGLAVDGSFVDHVNGGCMVGAFQEYGLAVYSRLDSLVISALVP